MDAVRGDLDAATPERLIARAEELRAARQAARKAATVPGHDVARVAELRAVVVRAREGAKDAEARAARLADSLERIPAWRRSERAQVRSDIERANGDRERHRGDGRAAQGDLARLGPVVSGEAQQRAQRLGIELSALESRLAPWRDSFGGGRAQPARDRAPAQRSAERDLGRER